MGAYICARRSLQLHFVKTLLLLHMRVCVRCDVTLPNRKHMQITMNGFWISTALHEPESDPKRFMIEAKLDPTDEVEEWHVRTSSS